jgi:hypothetical protein
MEERGREGGRREGGGEDEKRSDRGVVQSCWDGYSSKGIRRQYGIAIPSNIKRNPI